VTERYAHLPLGTLQTAFNSASIAMKGADRGFDTVPGGGAA
jgi:hypothetical protein